MTPPTGVECEEGEVRLVGGVTNSSGRLEVCANGMWGRVCNYLRYWDANNARVVCHQLGFVEKGEGFFQCFCVFPSIYGVIILYVLGVSVLSASIFGASSRPFVVGEVHCTGTETEVLECSHNSIGDHFCGDSTDGANEVAIACGMFLSR